MRKQDKAGIIVIVVLFALIAFLILVLVDPAFARAEETEVWILMKPGDYVNVRIEPRKKSQVIGFLDAGDGCWTDWKAM